MSNGLSRTLSVTALGLSAIAVLGACGPPTGPDPTPTAGGPLPPTETAAPPFPTTVVHSGGETTIEAAPESVVTFGHQPTESLLALGIVPDAAEVFYIAPWREDAISSLGGAAPVALDPLAGDTIADVEALSPDIIVTALPFPPYDADPAPWNTFYNALPDVAPTVGPAEAAISATGDASATSWRESLLQMGQIMGLLPEAETQLATIDGSLADHAAAHPEFSGKTVAYLTNGFGSVTYNKSNTPAAAVLEQLGFRYADDSTISYNSESASGTEYHLWADDLEQLDVDVLIILGDATSMAAWIPHYESSPTAAGGVIHYAGFNDEHTIGALHPSALSLPWAIDTFVADLAAAIGSR